MFILRHVKNVHFEHMYTITHIDYRRRHFHFLGLYFVNVVIEMICVRKEVFYTYCIILQRVKLNFGA